MKNESDKVKQRRRFLTGMGVVATTATLASATQAQERRGRRGFMPARHEEDAWLGAASGSHRVFIDSATTNGGVTALNYANNVLLGHTEGYGGDESDIDIVVCFRHGSTPLGYNDAMWEKYGEQLSRIMRFNDPDTDQPFSMNPMNMDRSNFANRGNTIPSLIERGVSYAICNKATRSFSGSIARMTGGDAEAIYQDLRANNIPNSRFVAAGVVALTRSQEYGYSLLYAG